MIKFQKGFTLIELLIVIVIIGILASLLVAYINPLLQFGKARNGARKADLRAITNALELYKLANDDYPISPVGYYWCDTASTGYYACGANNPLNVLIGTNGELKRLPVDPRDGKTYLPCNDGNQVGYLYHSDGDNYKLLAHCSPEGNAYKTTDPFYDPIRPTWSWQISTPGGINW